MKELDKNKSVDPKPSSLDTQSAYPEFSGLLIWSDADITMAYHRRKLDTS